jgi:hypothetical protein
MAENNIDFRRCQVTFKTSWDMGFDFGGPFVGFVLQENQKI